MSQERKRRVAVALILVGGLERRVARSQLAGLLEAPPVLLAAVVLGVAVSAVTARTFNPRASMTLEGVCTGGVVALAVAAILRERRGGHRTSVDP